ncbi:MAG: transcriptional repressor [Candidatus Heimdallarchaeota archaeon]
MELAKFGKTVSNPIRTLILSILAQNEINTLKECFILVKKEYPSIHRETVYRSLENLFQNGLILKEYSHVKKRLVYKLKSKKLVVNLLERTAKFD